MTSTTDSDSGDFIVEQAKRGRPFSALVPLANVAVALIEEHRAYVKDAINAAWDSWPWPRGKAPTLTRHQFAGIKKAVEKLRSKRSLSIVFPPELIERAAKALRRQRKVRNK